MDLDCGTPKNNDPIIRLAPSKEYCFDTTWTDGRIAPVARVQEWWRQSIRNNTPVIPGLTEGFLSQNACDIALKSNFSGQKLKTNLFE